MNPWNKLFFHICYRMQNYYLRRFSVQFLEKNILNVLCDRIYIAEFGRILFGGPNELHSVFSQNIGVRPKSKKNLFKGNIFSSSSRVLIVDL